MTGLLWSTALSHRPVNTFNANCNVLLSKTVLIPKLNFWFMSFYIKLFWKSKAYCIQFLLMGDWHKYLLFWVFEYQVWYSLWVQSGLVFAQSTPAHPRLPVTQLKIPVNQDWQVLTWAVFIEITGLSPEAISSQRPIEILIMHCEVPRSFCSIRGTFLK